MLLCEQESIIPSRNCQAPAHAPKDSCGWGSKAAGLVTRAWCHLVSPGVTWHHLASPGVTWCHLASPSPGTAPCPCSAGCRQRARLCLCRRDALPGLEAALGGHPVLRTLTGDTPEHCCLQPICRTAAALPCTAQPVHPFPLTHTKFVCSSAQGLSQECPEICHPT